MSKSLKKLIDINRLREFKNKLVGTGSAYVQTAAVDQTIAGTKTFSKPIVGSVTGSSGSCTGNAATATKLQAAHTINGTSFNGTANITTANWGTARNITITDGTNTSTAVSVNGSANVALTLPATIKANLAGNAATATTAATAKACTGNAATATKATQDSDGKQINTTYSKVGHTHDDRYYTETEVNNLLGGKANTSGTYSNLTVGNAGSATNATYANWLRTSSHSDHLFHTEWDKAGYFWTYVTAGNGEYRAVRVARSDSATNADHATRATQDSDGKQINTTYSKVGHTHDDRYYTETEVNNLLGGKANTSHDHNSVRTSDDVYHTISFDWSSQVPGCVGLTVDATKLGGIVTTARLRAQWYAAYPDGAEAHNAMWGGRDITAAFNNGTVSANIKNGTFKDIFPGDYITKQVTIPRTFADDRVTVLFDGGTYTVNWVITDCDYWINKGDQGNGMTTHHVAIVPQVPIFNARMNSTNTTADGYAGSEMCRNIILACTRGIVNAFGGKHILTFRDGITNSVDTSHVSSGIPQWTGTPGWWGSWVSAQCNLMSEKMVYGAPICASGAMDNSMVTRQMSAFRLSERLINYNRQWWWLRDVTSSISFAAMDSFGNAAAPGASFAGGVRPFALLV